LGSVSSEQGFGIGSVYTDSPRKCALGAALHAVGVKTWEETAYTAVEKRWPWVRQPLHECPACGIDHYEKLHIQGPSDYLNMIWILNDVHRMTRPQIAAWVASVEPKESGGQEQATVAPVEQVTIPAPCLMEVK
jgi:hypothetical protein